MLELIAVSYIVSVSLYLARRYPDFPERMLRFPSQDTVTLIGDELARSMTAAIDDIYDD